MSTKLSEIEITAPSQPSPASQFSLNIMEWSHTRTVFQLAQFTERLNTSCASDNSVRQLRT